MQKYFRFLFRGLLSSVLFPKNQFVYEITWFRGGAIVDQLSENNFESLFAGADNEKAVDIFSLRTVDLYTHEDDSGRGITTVADKDIQTRNEERIPQNTKRYRPIYCQRARRAKTRGRRQY